MSMLGGYGGWLEREIERYITLYTEGNVYGIIAIPVIEITFDNDYIHILDGLYKRYIYRYFISKSFVSKA